MPDQPEIRDSQPGPDQPVPTGPPSAPQPGPGSERRSRLLTIGLLLAAVALVMTWTRRGSHLAAPSAPPGPATGAPQAPGGGGEVGKPAPDFALQGLDGKTVHLSDFKGKVVIVDFWATWCEPCVIMIPWFISFQKQYGPKGLEIVGVAMDEEGGSVVKPWAEKMKMNYHVVLGNEQVANAYGGIFGLPTTFIIDREGRIHARHFGLVSRDAFQKDLHDLL